MMDRKLGRIAIISPELQPHLVPVTYEFDGKYFYLSGWSLRYGPRFQDLKPESKVALLVDDLAQANLWVPRGIEVLGDVEMLEKGDYLYLRITPVGKTSWGL